MQIRRVLIVGSSVALRVRPPRRERSYNFNYASLIETYLNKDESDDSLWIVENKGFTRAITRDILRLKDDISSSGASVVILNLGAVDAPTREIPLWYSDLISVKKKGKVSYHLFNLLHGALFKGVLRPFIVKLRGKRAWTSKKKFERDINEILDHINKDTCSKIIILGINSGNERIEKKLPGTISNYKVYNDILRKISEERSIDFVDVRDLNSKDHFPDGVHYNYDGHKEISDRILNLIR
tara:strand:- start:39648 stop:40367 length:720 start_codon:yes stop_codon:yes gene_type:complete